MCPVLVCSAARDVGSGLVLEEPDGETADSGCGFQRARRV